MKKPNGYGSVYKMKGKKLRKPWRVVTPPPSRRTIGYTATKKEGDLLLAEWHNNRNMFESPTLEELYFRFIQTKKFKTESTKKMYVNAWRYFEDLKNDNITDIKSRHIQDVIDSLIEEEKSYSTCHKVKMLASQLFQLACADDYCSKDYSTFVDLPKKPQADNRTFTNDEIEKLFVFSKTNIWAKIMLIMIFTCMRPSELLNVSKFNVKLKDNYIIAGSKTKAGTNRYIPVYHRIRPFIERFYRTSDSEYLITFEGEPVKYRYYLDKHNEVIEALNLQKLSPHKCRKTGSTFYQNQGMDPRVLQKVLGHASFDTTDKFYTGDISFLLQSEMEKVE